MFEISCEISRKHVPVQPKKQINLGNSTELSSKKLLEVSQNISLYYAPKISSAFKKLVILPVDPEHFYVYWNMQEKHNFELSQSISKQQLVLRVYAQSIEIKEIKKLKPFAEFTINNLQSGQKISLPSDHQSTVFSACIGKSMSKNTFEPLLVSRHSDVFIAKTDQNEQIESINLSSLENIETQKPESGLFNSRRPVKSHYASTNNSAKGKKR